MGLTTKNKKLMNSPFAWAFLGNKWIKFAFITALFTLICLVLFSRAVMSPISHDEYQFVAGAQFFRTNGLLPYVDYPFLHMPYIPVLYGVILQFSKYDLLTARLFNEFCLFLSIVLLSALTTQFFKNTSVIYQIIVGVFTILLFIIDPSLVTMDGRALNHSIPILLSISIVWLYWKSSNTRTRKIHLFICGLLAGVAIGTRLSYTVLIVPILYAILFDPLFMDRKDKLYSLTALGLGLFLALLPAAILFILAPKPFIYGNFHYIALNTIYRQNLGYTISMSFLDKMLFFYKQVLSKPTDLILYFGWICFLVTAIIHWIRTKEREFFLIIFVYSFGIVMLIAAFTPTPLWPQYFFGPLPFLILGLFLGISIFFKNQQRLLILSLVSLFAAILLNQPFKEIANHLNGLTKPEEWTTTQIHQLSEEIGAEAGCAQSCKILTLVPILPLEAGLDTYPMFTVGSFSWRTAPLLSRERRADYRIISHEDLFDYLNNDPPAAIITGTEAHYDGFTKYDPGKLDQPFIDYAIMNEYKPIKMTDNFDADEPFITLWVK